jgi:hypothetical protein
MSELASRVKQFYRWEPIEARDIAISIIAITFIFAFDDRAETFELAHWIANFILTLIIVAVSFLAYDAAMKLAALNQGFRAEYRMWLGGIVFSLILTLLTKGKWYVLFAGGLYLHHLAILRLGKFRYGLNVAGQGTIAAAGPAAHFVLLTISLMLSRQFQFLPGLFDYVAKINGYMMIYQLLPVPRMNGIHIFFMSRLAYIFIAGSLISYVILVQLKIYSWVLALLIGAGCWVAWYWFREGGNK